MRGLSVSDPQKPFTLKKHNFLTALLVAGATSAVFAQTARLGIIHNSADAAASEVDIYVYGNLFKDDFAYCTTMGFVDLPVAMSLEMTTAARAIIASGFLDPSANSNCPTFGLWSSTGQGHFC